MLKRKTIIIAVLLISMLSSGIFFTRCKTKKKDYNVVLIVIDTLRSDHLPFYGYPKNTAPFLWDLSKKSIVFKNTYSASSWTSPGTASIFTSMYPFQHGVKMGLLAIRKARKIDPTVKINRIPEKITTITEVLKENGYVTYGLSDNLNIDARQGFTQGFDKFRTFIYSQAPNVNNTIKKWRQKLMSSEKYFLYIQYMDPHAPYHQREPWYQPQGNYRANRIAAYDSEINYADQHIKELFELFQWDKNTLVIITSDHGEGLWDHGMMAHGKSLYREEIQVPLMIYLPGGTTTREVTENATTLDILPTVREILGLPASKSDEGLSLVPLIENRPNSFASRNIYSHLWFTTDRHEEWKSTIHKNWHFFNKLPDNRLLFSLLTDKEEKNNLLINGIKIATELEKSFDTFYKTCHKFTAESSTVKLDKEKADKLKSLGYVN